MNNKDEYITEPSSQYELIDSGDGKKLERYGNIKISRPDPQAIWPKSLSEKEWMDTDADFKQNDSGKSKWHIKKNIPNDWKVTLGEITFNLQLLPSKHLGVFPEQSVHWKWLSGKVSKNVSLGRKVSVLNLFGYTGGSTLACAKFGAEVCHVDASRFAIDLAMKNIKSSDLSKPKIRFIVDDVRKFVEREIKRGKKYDIIIMDPPVYGKGFKKEIWKIEKDLLPLLSRVKKIISGNPIAIILNGYSSGYSHTTYRQILSYITSDFSGTTTSGEISIKESSSRLLPCGIFARWEM